MNITILGCGAYGTALAHMFKENNCNIKMWNKFEDVFPNLKKELPNIEFTTDMKESLENTELIVIAIPIAFLDDVAIELSKFYKNQDILIASKGININDGLFANQIIEKHIKINNIGAISGGTFAIDMKSKKVMGLTLGTTSQSLITKVKNALENKYLKIQYTSDLIGVEICGAIKNVMAIGFGILDGANYPESSRFLFLTEAIYEINKLIKELNGKNNTIMSYAGIDDIMMTCTSSKSRNYTLGKLLGENKDQDTIEEYKKNTTVEGLGTALAIHNLCEKINLKLNICNIIYNILYNNENSITLIKYLEEKESCQL